MTPANGERAAKRMIGSTVAGIVTIFLMMSPAGAASAARYQTFRPLDGVTVKQVGPQRVKFVNRTPYCVALRVKVVKRDGFFTIGTHRIDYTHQTDRLWFAGRVTRVTVYKPGC